LIKRLNIRNFAVIDELELEFHTGMTVLTGETGAGKSILIDALGLLLGDRAEAGVIRNGCERAELAAQFDIAANPVTRGQLEELDIESDSRELLLRRVITRDGRSSAFINGSPATAQLLRTIGENLVDIHGQHSHQSLTRPETQRRLLDEFGNHTASLNSLRTAHDQWHAASGRLQALLGRETDQEATLNLLRYQVEELRGLRPEAGEYDALDDEHRRLSNGARLLEAASHALQAFADDDHALHARIASITSELRSLRQYDTKLDNIVATLDETMLHLNEAGSELRHYLDGLQIDPDRLQTVETRLSRLHEMARKHRVQPRDLAGHFARLEQQLTDMENSREIIGALQQSRDAALTQYRTAAAALHQHRLKTARKLGDEITAKLGELGMRGGKFAISVERLNEELPRAHGDDGIEFLVTANPGLAPQPLRKIASGGELSRISLAIQVVGVRDTGIPTLIFDEVDAGIGGAIAEIVGKLLHQLARKRQVFCVTHLPQVASQGDRHLLVNKTSSRTSTRTGARELNPEERIDEIARMLGGVKITEQSRRHAQEMLASAG
jgi:DNA repair protein RecN (Recombination protein N)